MRACGRRDSSTQARGTIRPPPDGEIECEPDQVLLRIHQLLVAGRGAVPVVALEAGAHGEEVSNRDRALARVGVAGVDQRKTPRSIAIPVSIPATVFVHERVLRSVEASPSAYSSITISPPRRTATLVIAP
jgi:hypothetical protein